MKRILQGALLLCMMVLICAPAIVSRAYVISRSYDYTIENYRVDMKVTPQNTYQIEETLEVTFQKQRHGIYRDIPIVNDVERQDGSKDRIVARVENISCGEDKYEVSREGNICRIQIGDEDETLIGSKTYHISYDYVMGKDVLEDNDEFYFNVIGNGWNTTIRNVSFSIEMPGEFEEENLGMAYGSYGSQKHKDLYYSIEENVIHGKLDSDVVLQPKCGVTVRLLLPEGYFIYENETSWFVYGAIALGIAGMILGFVLWYTYGRDDTVVETVEFHAPDGLNSVDLAFVYKGNLGNDDVISLIVYLAQKGYLEIQEESGKRSKDFVLIKKKPYDGDNEAERLFLNGLFGSGNRATKKSLQNKFYKTVESIVSLVNRKENKQKIFYANSLNKGKFLWAISLAVYFLAGFVPLSQYHYSAITGAIAALGVGIAFMMAFSLLFTQAELWVRIMLFIVVGFISLMGYFIFDHEALHYAGLWYQTAYYFAVVASGVMMFFSSYMSKRTEYGTQMLGRIRGFKHFLEVAEKQRLEMLVAENPQYFYEILPYTYVLGISDKWIKKFESISLEPPAWYGSHSGGTFNMVMFGHFMNTTMKSASAAMTSTPSSGGGGGFSGGGSGGGGGGSW